MVFNSRFYCEALNRIAQGYVCRFCHRGLCKWVDWAKPLSFEHLATTL